ncbi:MAG TPA: histidine kinase [Sphingomicrobium sp.]|nr:histidine kinase [Sphingomicrobium sp.]
MFDDVLKHRSGRVIALARAALAAVFLFAIWIDPSKPATAAVETYGVLATYAVAAAVVAAVTWDNWWLDARLAAPMHVVDILAFTLLVLTSDGYTSPFFVFFVFLILTAAIRWGWRETALTAVPVTLLYVAAALVAGTEGGEIFDFQRFIIRAGNLVILSGVLIWFGVNHGFSGLRSLKDDLLRDVSPGESPLESAIEGAAAAAGGTRALLLWRGCENEHWLAIHWQGAEFATKALPAHSVGIAAGPALFDIKDNRAICRAPSRRTRFCTAGSVVDVETACEYGIGEGLSVPIRTAAGEGVLLLGGIEGLCTDHIDFGETLGSALAAHIQRHALLAAVEGGAIARARLSLARDLHDSIVQFLAGATFRIEAVSRALRAGEQPERELKDLKRLLLQEQQELRSAIGALKSETIPLPKLAGDLRALCGRLAMQWDVQCRFSAEVPETTAPMRLHLDTHQLIREAVANAVRHARAKRITVQLTAGDGDLRLDISNDGGGSERLKEGTPWSLRERVDEANGTLMLATRETGTQICITLPLEPEARP